MSQAKWLKYLALDWYGTHMPSAKTTNTNNESSAMPNFEAPIEAAKKLFEGFKPNFDAFKNFDLSSLSPEAVRTSVIEGVKQTNKRVLETASTVSEMVAKVAPAQQIPFAAEIQEAVKANAAFVGELIDLQREFASELFATLVPAK